MRPNRALLLALLVLIGVLALWLLRERGPHAGWWPGCLFHQMTSLHCPGCGMTRATHAALHGDWAAAFRHNALGMVLLPLALLGVGLELLGWARGGRPWLRLTPWRGLALATALAVCAFWLLRNLPWWPCTLLAPPG